LSKIKRYKPYKENLFVISPTTKKFIDSLIDYYISEAASYKQMAQSYTDETSDVTSTAFGIIVGCIYSGFLQAYTNEKKKPTAEDTQEFAKIIKSRSAKVIKSINEAKP
jgi:hypothetical protein